MKYGKKWLCYVLKGLRKEFCFRELGEYRREVFNVFLKVFRKYFIEKLKGFFFFERSRERVIWKILFFF